MLDPTQLANRLAAEWLRGDGLRYPDSVARSADVFAGICSEWFAAAQAGPFPVVTALPRRPMLMSLAIPPLSAQDPSAAGNQLASAASLYIAGQVFSGGTALPPAGTGAAGGMLAAAFSARDLDREPRARLVATALHLLALTTVVSFPFPPFVANVS